MVSELEREAMLVVSFPAAREKLKVLCGRANDDAEMIVITRKQSDNVVMLSEAEV